MNELLQFLMNPPPAPSLEGVNLAIAPLVFPLLKFGLPIVSSFLGGLLGGGSKKSTKQTGTTSNFYNDPRAQQFSTDLFDRFESQLGRSLPNSQEALDYYGLARAGAVNRGFAGAENNLQADLARRGLSFSPGPQGVGFGNLAAARGGALADVGGEIARMRYELPMMQERIMQQRLQQASQYLQFQPRGQSTDRTLQTQGRVGNRWADAFGGAVAASPFNQSKQFNPSDWPDVFGGGDQPNNMALGDLNIPAPDISASAGSRLPSFLRPQSPVGSSEELWGY